MIIDWQDDPGFANLHEILDATTWQPLPMDEVHSCIFYADDQKGILRVGIVDAKGTLAMAFENDPQTPIPTGRLWQRYSKEGNALLPEVVPAWREIKRPIRIVKKEPMR